MGRRVLIISPKFPPVNAADHQRIRMSLPYFQEFGWEPWVLSVRGEDVGGVQDPLLLKTIPDAIPIIQTKALPSHLTRRFGIGEFSWRCLPYLARAGTQLLTKQPFDLIYFSTTVFLAMALAPWWQQRFKIPYILDFQDLWLNDYYDVKGVRPPGGYLKYGVAKLLAQTQEPGAMQRVSQVISVSPEYPKILQQRYPWLRADQFNVLPFGAPEADFELLPTFHVQQRIFDPNDGKRHWVYVGRGGSDMGMALRSLFLAIHTARQQDPAAWDQIRLHFVGTSYASADRAEKTIEPVAQEMGVADLVTEHAYRIPYFEALQTLVDSDAILLIGSDDPNYTASKLYPCVLARKPIVAIFHAQSSVVDILRQCEAGHAITFNTTDQPADLTPSVNASLDWLRSQPKGWQPDINWSAFQPYTAREMTRQQCAVFDRCLPVVNQEPSP